MTVSHGNMVEFLAAAMAIWCCNVVAGSGTEVVSDGRGDDNTCCLSDDVILRLAHLGVKVPFMFNLDLLDLYCYNYCTPASLLLLLLLPLS